LGSIVFDLTFLNEVSRRHETIKDIHAQVIDSCIAVINSRPLIRANHLVQKIPLYYDETPRSKPDLSQPVVPVTALVTTRDELLPMIQFEGKPALQQALRALCREFIDVFSTAMPMVIDIDRSKWELPCNRLP